LNYIRSLQRRLRAATTSSDKTPSCRRQRSLSRSTCCKQRWVLSAMKLRRSN